MCSPEKKSTYRLRRNVSCVSFMSSVCRCCVLPFGRSNTINCRLVVARCGGTFCIVFYYMLRWIRMAGAAKRVAGWLALAVSWLRFWTLDKNGYESETGRAT
jgi:hypothetical protein